MSISDPESDLEAGPGKPDPRIGPASPGLVQFARETLGCHCPTEVFERVEDRRKPLPGLPEISRRIAVGGRLLIYVAEVPEGTDPVPWVMARLGTWVAAGLTERDRRGMNRLRIAVSIDDLDRGSVEAIEAGFTRLPVMAERGTDPRIHLHCLPRLALAGL